MLAYADGYRVGRSLGIRERDKVLAAVVNQGVDAAGRGRRTERVVCVPSRADSTGLRLLQKEEVWA